MRDDQPTGQASPFIDTYIPARLDRLPWSRFHWLVVVALGVTWILDGLEVTLAGAVAAALQESPTLRLDSTEIGAAASAYLLGAIGGAVFFGWLTDRWGRKRLFTITLGLYLVATAATALSWNFWSFALFRFLTGAGIGGEGTAINSAIQELIPARYRGRTDIIINGSFWIGAALGAASTLILLDPALLPPDLGWRVAFGTGAVLGLFILFLRRFVPESPRWLMIHGRIEEANLIVDEIEQRVVAGSDVVVLAPAVGRLRVSGRGHAGLAAVLSTLFTTHRQRTVLGLVLITAQAFFYNAIFFTYALILTRFYDVPSAHIGRYILPFALGNFCGPLLLGHLFDTLGRKTMIAATYALSGVLLALTAWLFALGLLDATTQTIAWTIIFFFASSAASSAYLTVSEIFPLEIRALAIALFYAMGTLLGGVVAPSLFGWLIETGARSYIVGGYLVAAMLMVGAAIVELVIGVAAERRPLESIAAPLSQLEAAQDHRAL
ncbi:MAG TPA: MFS transporter [Stellaceae bacterium]|nr:MFS transporter [Stellaceae bacterium]